MMNHNSCFLFNFIFQYVSDISPYCCMCGILPYKYATSGHVHSPSGRYVSCFKCFVIANNTGINFPVLVKWCMCARDSLCHLWMKLLGHGICTPSIVLKGQIVFQSYKPRYILSPAVSKCWVSSCSHQHLILWDSSIFVRLSSVK